MSTTTSDERLRRRRGWVATVGVLVVLLAGLTVVWRLGGFERRQDLFTEAEPGTLLTTGPYELTLTSATAQHKTDDKLWEIVVTGTIRTTGDTSIRPATGDDGFLVAQQGSRETQSVTSFTLGDGKNALIDPDVLTPGLPPVTFGAKFSFDTAPSAKVRVAVFGQEYTTAYVFGDEKAWRSTKRATDVYLPLTTLPESKY